jgi:hypothetical protein
MKNVRRRLITEWAEAQKPTVVIIPYPYREVWRRYGVRIEYTGSHITITQ